MFVDNRPMSTATTEQCFMNSILDLDQRLKSQSKAIAMLEIPI